MIRNDWENGRSPNQSRNHPNNSNRPNESEERRQSPPGIDRDRVTEVINNQNARAFVNNQSDRISEN